MSDPNKREVEGIPGSLETRAWLRMLACASLVETELRNRLREEFATTLPRFDVLAQIARPPAEPTMSELSQRLMVTKGSITDVIGRLEAEELVVRRRDPADARVMRVHLTPRGQRLVGTMVPAHNAWLAELLCGFDHDELRQLDSLLGRLRTALRARRPA